MKWIVGELGEMNVPFKPDTKPVKHRPYRLKLVYKQKEKVEIDRMLEAGIIEPVAESECNSPLMVQDEKIGGIKICVDEEIK